MTVVIILLLAALVIVLTLMSVEPERCHKEPHLIVTTTWPDVPEREQRAHTRAVAYHMLLYDLGSRI